MPMNGYLKNRFFLNGMNNALLRSISKVLIGVYSWITILKINLTYLVM